MERFYLRLKEDYTATVYYFPNEPVREQLIPAGTCTWDLTPNGMGYISIYLDEDGDGELAIPAELFERIPESELDSEKWIGD